MHADLLTLARQVAALPGAPTPPEGGSDDAPEGVGYFDEETELCWRWYGGWVLDLTNAATGGVMLAALPFAVKVVTRTEPRAVRVMWLEEDGEGLGPRQHTTQWCDSLGVAVARVMVARGRW